MMKKIHARLILVAINIILFFTSVLLPACIGSDSKGLAILTKNGNKMYSQFLYSGKSNSVKQFETTEGPMDSSWPMYCHDTHHTGQSQYSTITNNGGIKWKYKTDQGILSPPVIGKDGTIFVGCGNYYGPLYAIYPNGTKKWQFNTCDMIMSSPAIDENGTIYIGSEDGYFYAVHPNGTMKWKFAPGGKIDSSPAIAPDRTIYVGTYDKGYLCALNPNGTEKWHYDPGDWVFASPAVADDGTVYITSNNHLLSALYPNGTLQWITGQIHGFLGSPTVGEDGTVYIANKYEFNGSLYAIYPNGTLKWRKDIGSGSTHTPSLGNDGTIYIGADKLYAFFPDGSNKWIFNSGLYASSDALAISEEGTIYFGASNYNENDGYLFAVNPDGTEKWREWICNSFLWSSPAIANDGTVYIGSALVSTVPYGFLYAFNGKQFKDPVMEKLKNGKIYLFDRELRLTLPDSHHDPFVFGKLTIMVSQADPVNVSRVEFYIDGVKRYVTATLPYQWTWTGYAFWEHYINVSVWNVSGMNKQVGIYVIKIF